MWAKYHRYKTETERTALFEKHRCLIEKLFEDVQHVTHDRLLAIATLEMNEARIWISDDSNEHKETRFKNLQIWKCERCERHNLVYSDKCVECSSNIPIEHRQNDTQKQVSSRLNTVKIDSNEGQNMSIVHPLKSVN